MATVLKEFGIRRAEDGDIGVEIEVEGVRLPRCRNFWKNERDGSLRGEEAVEYVLTSPSSLEGVKKALKYLDELYTANGSIVDDSVRAGVHVHINCQKLTMLQLYNFIVVYLVLENLLVHWCGEFREGNLFCLRSCDAEWLSNIIRLAASDDKKMFKARFHNDNIRYASINVKALGDYGSLEFRAMRGTRDLESVYKWAETLYNLREFSKQFNTPHDIMERFSLAGPVVFAQDALGENYKLFVDNVAEAGIMLHQGMRVAQDIAYSTSWATFEPKMVTVGGVEFSEQDYINNPDEPPEDV